MIFDDIFWGEERSVEMLKRSYCVFCIWICINIFLQIQIQNIQYDPFNIFYPSFWQQDGARNRDWFWWNYDYIFAVLWLWIN